MKHISLSGRLGQKPEVRQVNSGDTVVCEFDIAVEHYDRQLKERVPEWYTIVCFGKQAEFMGTYPDKGDAVVASGEPQIEQYTSKKYTDSDGNGAPMKKLKLVAPPGGVGVYYKGSPEGRGAGMSDNTSGVEPANDLDGDDIPF